MPTFQSIQRTNSRRSYRLMTPPSSPDSSPSIATLSSRHLIELPRAITYLENVLERPVANCLGGMSPRTEARARALLESCTRQLNLIGLGVPVAETYSLSLRSVQVEVSSAVAVDEPFLEGLAKFRGMLRQSFLYKYREYRKFLLHPVDVVGLGDERVPAYVKPGPEALGLFTRSSWIVIWTLMVGEREDLRLKRRPTPMTDVVQKLAIMNQTLDFGRLNDCISTYVGNFGWDSESQIETLAGEKKWLELVTRLVEDLKSLCIVEEPDRQYVPEAQRAIYACANTYFDKFQWNEEKSELEGYAVLPHLL